MSNPRKLTDFWKPLSQSHRPHIPPPDARQDTIVVTDGRHASSAVHEPVIGDAQAAPVEPIGLSRPQQERAAFLDTHYTASEEQSTAGPPLPLPASAPAQRVIRNGKVIIRSSDTEESDSDPEGLEELDDLFARHKKAPGDLEAHVGVIQDAATDRTKPSGGRSLRSGTNKANSPTRAVIRDVPKYKFSLQNLVARTEREAAVEAQIAKARAAIDGRHEGLQNVGDHKSANAALTGAGDVDKQLLSSVLQEEDRDTGLQKVMDAMRRTEALNRKKTWSFFEGPAYVAREGSPQSLRSFGVLGEGQTLAADRRSMENTFLSGFPIELLSFSELPDEMLLWMLDELCFEPRDDLRRAYSLALNHCHAGRLDAILQPASLDDIFRKLGAKAEALDLTILAVPIDQSSNGPPPQINNIRTVLEFLGSVSKLLCSPSKERILALLCRVALDEALTTFEGARRALETAFSSILGSFTATELDGCLSRVIRTIKSFVSDSQLQVQVLDCIPISSRRLHRFRRDLALSMLLETISPDPNFETTASLKDFIRYLDDRLFSVDRSTDYGKLAAVSTLLDIALDDGRLSTEFSRKTEEDQFNSDVDFLGKRIQALFSTIVDTGASHMTRTEAKEVLERLHYRLVYSVRTKQKPKETIFGAAVGNTIERYLQIGGPESDKKDVQTS